MLDTEVVGGISIIKMVYYGAASGIFGIILGYVLRWGMTAGKRGSAELEVKQMLLSAKEDAQRIVQESERKAERQMEELRAAEKEKEKEWKRSEERLLKKEEALDKKQEDIEAEMSYCLLS